MSIFPRRTPLFVAILHSASSQLLRRQDTNLHLQCARVCNSLSLLPPPPFLVSLPLTRSRFCSPTLPHSLPPFALISSPAHTEPSVRADATSWSAHRFLQYVLTAHPSLPPQFVRRRIRRAPAPQSLSCSASKALFQPLNRGIDIHSLSHVHLPGGHRASIALPPVPPLPPLPPFPAGV